jgi:hypothetical protein
MIFQPNKKKRRHCPTFTAEKEEEEKKRIKKFKKLKNSTKKITKFECRPFRQVARGRAKRRIGLRASNEGSSGLNRKQT